jgi:hypothetical protein
VPAWEAVEVEEDEPKTARRGSARRTKGRRLNLRQGPKSIR